MHSMHLYTRSKFKKCLFPAPNRPLENVAIQNIFWVTCDDFFFVTGNRDRKFRYCSRIYVRNWFILLNELNPLLDFEGTRFVNERSIWTCWSFAAVKVMTNGELEKHQRGSNFFLINFMSILKKKKKSSYL